VRPGAPLGQTLPSDAAPLASAPPPDPSAGVSSRFGVSAPCPTEDADAEPCAELLGAPSLAAANLACLGGGGVTCLLTDPGHGVVWSGHSDGRVVSWRLEAARAGQPAGLGGGAVAAWQAHKGPISALTLTAAGALWTGGKGGTLRAWHPGITLAGPPASSSVSAAAALAGALSGPPVADGARTLARKDGCRPHSEVRGLATILHGGERGRELVWSAGTTSFVIWDAASHAALRVLAPDGSIVPDVRPEAAAADGGAEEERGGGGFLGRMAKAVERRVQRASEYMDGADAGTLPGGPRITALAAAPWGGVVAVLEGAGSGLPPPPPGAPQPGTLSEALGSGWGCALQRYSSDGSPAPQPHAPPAPVRCLLSAEGALWAGLASGQVLALAPAAASQPQAGPLLTVAQWHAHKAPLAALAGGPGGRIFSLAEDGQLRGWAAASARDAGASRRLTSALRSALPRFSAPTEIRIFSATWNVAEKKPEPRSVRAWVGAPCPQAARGGSACAAFSDVAVFGLQEIEKLNASSVGASAAKELVGLGETLNANGQWWQVALLAALEETNAAAAGGGGAGVWEPLAARQLSGLLILVFVRKALLPHLGAPLTASAACGIMGVGGNKGGVGVRVQLHRRAFVFVAVHLAAHQGATRKRNSNTETILANLAFEPALGEHWRAAAKREAAEAGVAEPAIAPQPLARSNSMRVPRAAAGFGAGAADDSGDDEEEAEEAAAATAASGKLRGSPPAGGAGDAELLLYLGDMNYRLDGIRYEEACAAATRGDLAALAKHDQLLRERAAGRTLPGLQEGPLRFPPSYKFDKGCAPGALAYDSSEKRRVPAWCDRVLWADAVANGAAAEAASGAWGLCSELESYDSVMDVCESDHKPVRAMLKVSFPVMDERRRRRAWVLAEQGLAGAEAAPAPVADLIAL